MKQAEITIGKAAGFTLIEAIVTMAVIAVIAAIALPAYSNHVMKAKRSIAKGELMEVLARQEQYFVNNKSYATTFTALGYGASPYYIDDQGNETTTAASRTYQIAFTTDSSSSAFTLQAIPQNSQSNDKECGTLQLSNTGLRSISGGTGTAAVCW